MLKRVSELVHDAVTVCEDTFHPPVVYDPFVLGDLGCIDRDLMQSGTVAVLTGDRQPRRLFLSVIHRDLADDPRDEVADQLQNCFFVLRSFEHQAAVLDFVAKRVEHVQLLIGP